jgi:hypothetical protein
VSRGKVRSKSKQERLFNQHDDGSDVLAAREGHPGPVSLSRGLLPRPNSDSNTPELGRPRHNSGYGEKHSMKQFLARIGRAMWHRIPFDTRQIIKQFVLPYSTIRNELDCLVIQVNILREDVRAIAEMLKGPLSEVSIPWNVKSAANKRSVGTDASACLGRAVTSRICKTEHFSEPQYLWWARALGENYQLHRKQWEFYCIAQGLWERGLLKPEAVGLGFGVGREPMPALFARFGCRITATDAPPDGSIAANWGTSFQHSSGLRFLNERRICPPDLFAQLVTFRAVDMNNIPADLNSFDFLWSSCALEHLGSIEHGKRFVLDSLKCLRPGGYAFHTTEYNLWSDEDTIDAKDLAFYRKRDLLDLERKLRALGHSLEPFDFDEGNHVFDRLVDYPPYSVPHLRVYHRGFVFTSVVMVIRKGRGDAAGRDGIRNKETACDGRTR